MATVQGATSSAGVAATQASAAASSTNATQDRFLKLLVTQMRNQDPLNPMDNAQVTSQMAQLSTVSGIDNLNKTMSSLSSAFLSNQVLQSAALIGKNVLASGTTTNLAAGVANFGVDIPQGVDKLTVTIKDSAGNVMQSLDLGPQAAGTMPLSWDGIMANGTAAPAGTYTISATGMSGGNSVNIGTLTYDKVTSVSQGAGGVTLNLAGNTTVALTDVKRIL